MGNASKGLLIAGAILLAILLISFGILIYNNATATAVTSSQSQQEYMLLIKFNNQYQLYEGIQTGRAIKVLLQQAAENNSTLYTRQDSIKDCVCIRSDSTSILSKFTDTEMKVALNGTRSYGVRYPSNINQISNVLQLSSRYKIEFNYNEKGYIWEIWIRDL